MKSTSMHLLISVLYKLFVCLLNLLTFFLTYLLPYLCTLSIIGPFLFQTGGRRRRPNLALVFLGRLFWVDLIKWVSICLSVHKYLRTYVHKSFFDFNDFDEWCTSVCSMTRSKVKVTSPWKLEIWPFSKATSSAIYNMSWQVANWPLILN